MEKFEKIGRNSEFRRKEHKKRHLEQYSMEKHLASWKSFFYIWAKESMNKVKKRLDALTSQILANPALGKDDAIISELRGLRELLQTWRAFYAVQGQYSDDLPEGPRQVREASQTWD